jgi:hypothetical protein
MASTALSDIVDVVVYRDLPQVVGPEKSAFFQSGVVTRSPLLDALAGESGRTSVLPFWNDLDGSIEVNYSNDVPGDVGDAMKIAQGEQTARKAFINKGFSSTALASQLAMGPTAMEAIRAAVGRYFQRQWQRRLIAACSGLLADNVAANGGDMVHDVAAESVAAQTADTRFNRDAFVSAAFTMGDGYESLVAIAVHSTVYAQMVRNDDVVMVPDSEGKLTIPTYLGKRIIVDDGLPVIAGATDGFKYVSVLYGPGAFGYGETRPANATAIETDESGGNGGGVETLWERYTWLLHPYGYQQVGTPATETGFTLAELATAAVWTRVLPRKLVPIAFLVTN